ncbi:MAG: GNAT family N-acetyltransferase [Woeseiaceae bacterium]
MSNPDHDIRFELATAEQAAKLAPLIYESSHELLEFMFGDRTSAEKALTCLIARPNGHFSYKFVTLLVSDDEICGAELGYSAEELAAEEFSGALNMMRAMPFGRWPHLIGPVNRALAGYVMPPSPDAYYINNIAVDSSRRGGGFGQKFLDYVVHQARTTGYRCIELDVTDINDGGIRFYERYGFCCVAESSPENAVKRYGLPGLKRMRLLLDDKHAIAVNNYERPTSAVVISDPSRLNVTEVDEVYAPGSAEQLQAFVKASDKPISIGGGRYSMGGQTAQPGTIHVDMRGLNKVLELDVAEASVRVQAGARWSDVQRVADDYGFSVQVMQTYSNFTVGGSLSVNCHGRYIGLGPIILSVQSIQLLLHDGELIGASPSENAEVFYAAIGGYGALGIITEVTLSLATNTRIERLSRKMPLGDYPDFFQQNVRNDSSIIFHNADMVPPNFDKVRAISWKETKKSANRKPRKEGRSLYLAEKYMLWAITESRLGHFRREYIYESLLYLRPKITWRNDEASYDVAELEPLSRRKSTYVLQEYFVPVARIIEFSGQMTEILRRYSVQVVNVSIRHAHPDPGSLLAWAQSEVFALVLYYKQGTAAAKREAVAVWTRELIDAVLGCEGTYYLPYQPHGRVDQFHSAYPRAKELFALKKRLDPNYRFRNSLWAKYMDQDNDAPLLGDRDTSESEFLHVYGDVRSRDNFYRFLQVIYHLYPEAEFHQLIIDSCAKHDTDKAIYEEVARRLPNIKTTFSDLTYALPALWVQKNEMVRQTKAILPGRPEIHGYLEIGSTGRYVKGLKKALRFNGRVYLTNDVVPDNSPPEIMERGGIGKVGSFFALNDYDPIPDSEIPDESVDLVTCYIGLHHCPREKLDAYIDSIRRVLRPGGMFVLRDHDAGTDDMKVFCSLVHTVFNAGLGVPWQQDREELRLFEGIDFWADQIVQAGFEDNGKRFLQDHDPSLNTLTCFVKA